MDFRLRGNGVLWWIAAVGLLGQLGDNSYRRHPKQRQKSSCNTAAMHIVLVEEPNNTDRRQDQKLGERQSNGDCASLTGITT
jgi:hypothetical protein